MKQRRSKVAFEIQDIRASKSVLENIAQWRNQPPCLSIILLLPSVGDGVQTPGEIFVILPQTTLTTLSRVHSRVIRFALGYLLRVFEVKGRCDLFSRQPITA